MHRHRAHCRPRRTSPSSSVCAEIEDATIDGLEIGSLRMMANGSTNSDPRPSDVSRSGLGVRLSPRGDGAVYGLAENAVGLAFPPLGRAPMIDRMDRSELAARQGGRRQGRRETRPTRRVRRHAAGRSPASRSVSSTRRRGGRAAGGSAPPSRPSATSGYLDNPEKNRELFDGRWLNSGDLAYTAGGDVFITGRSRTSSSAPASISIRRRSRRRSAISRAFARAASPCSEPPTRVPAPSSWSWSRRPRLTDADALAELRQQVGETAARLLDAPPEQILLVPPAACRRPRAASCGGATRDLFHRGRLGARPQSASRQLVRLAITGLNARVRQHTRAVAGLAYALWWWIALVVTSTILWPLVVLVPRQARRWTIVRHGARLLLRLMAIRIG